MSFLEIEISLTWIAVIFYAIASVMAAIGLVFKRDWAMRHSTTVAWAGLVIHAVPILMRWVVAGHGPYHRIHEIVGSDVWVGVLFFLLLTLRYSNLKAVGVFVLPVAFSLLAWATLSDPLIRPLPPTFKSVWLVIHIIFAKLSIDSILIAFGLALLYLTKRRWLKKNDLSEAELAADGGSDAGSGKGTGKSLYGRLPSLTKIDDLSYRFLAFGFIFLGVMIVAGAIWAQQAWSRWWSWDPVETWSLVTWFLYGLFLHLRITYKFKGSKSAYLMILILVMTLTYHFGIPLISDTIHKGTTI